MKAAQHHDIEELAYLIWERAGRPEGLALDHWLEAEYMVLTGSFSREVEESGPEADVALP